MMINVYYQQSAWGLPRLVDGKRAILVVGSIIPWTEDFELYKMEQAGLALAQAPPGRGDWPTGSFKFLLHCTGFSHANGYIFELLVETNTFPLSCFCWGLLSQQLEKRILTCTGDGETYKQETQHSLLEFDQLHHEP